MAALRCRQRGLSVIAIDRSEDIFPLPRALGMDDEIQEVFCRAGLGDALRRFTTPLRGGEFVDAAGHRVVGVELPDGMTGSLGLPPVVTFHQPGIELSLRDAANAAGAELRLGLTATTIAELDDHIRLDAIGPHGQQSIRARWLIAADGAKSTIRELCGIELVDQGFDQTWLVVDTTLLDSDLPLPRIARQICDPARVATFVPGPGDHRRWEFQLHEHETRDDVLDEAVVQDLLRPWGTAEQLRVDRSAVYRFHATVADRLRAGRVFLAGDAAHQMPPFNGQGMCTGIRDAENLAWKLEMVASGRAGDTLLDTYDAERRSHAAGQVAHAVDAGQLMQAIAHDGTAALESGYGQRPFPKLTGAGFEPGHPLVGGVLPAPAIEIDPLPDGWKLLTTGALDLTEEWRSIDAAAINVPAAAYPGLLDDGAVMVVRPDRHIAAVSHDLRSTTDRVFATLGTE